MDENVVQLEAIVSNQTMANDTVSQLEASFEALQLAPYNGPYQDPIKLEEGFNLFSHQQEALQWMKKVEDDKRSNQHGMAGGILNLSMGLGKTLTTLYHALNNNGSYPTLILAPKAVLDEWYSDIHKFFGDRVKVLMLHRDYLKSKFNKVDREMVVQHDVVLTTYDVCVRACIKAKHYISCLEFGEGCQQNKVVSIHTKNRRDANHPHYKGANVVYGTPWHRVVCDESQRFTNHESAVFKSVMAIYGKYKWCLSGTPIRNSELDIWTQLRFCGYKTITKAKDWKYEGHKTYITNNLGQYVFRTTKDDVKHLNIPIKVEHDIIVGLGSDHSKIYQDMLLKTKQAYVKMLWSSSESFSCVLALFTKLRQCAISMDLVKTPSDESQVMDDCCGTSNKFIEVLKIVKKIQSIESPQKDKIIIFSMFSSALKLLGTELEKNHIQYKLVCGSNNGCDKEATFQRFKEDPNTNVLLMTYRVGSEGLNLTEANHCICLEPWWNNAVHEQAKARVWRMGQTKKVEVYNLYMENSIEEKIKEVCMVKDDISSSFLNGTQRTLKKQSLNKEMLGRLLGIWE